MKPSPPCLERKQYLSGVDWFIRALDCRTRSVTGTGNYSQVVLVLDGDVDDEALRRKLGSFIAHNPVLGGRCRRNMLNLAPYWDMNRPVHGEDLPFEVRTVAADTSMQEILGSLSERVNLPIDEGLRIAFTVVHHGSRSHVAMRFDHHVLDAVGAERLLMLVSESEDCAATVDLGDRGAHLDRWRDKFKSGQVVNREILALRGGNPPTALPFPAGRHGGRLHTRFVFRTYSEAETARIGMRAEKSVGYLLLLPYLLGVSVHALHRVCDRMGLAQGDYVVPVSMDTRSTDRSGECLFFNHLSFNFYRFDIGAATEQAALWQQAVGQMYAHVQKRVAHHLANAGMLMRILPAQWLGRMMALPLGGRMGSMSFALVGQGGYTAQTFMGVPVDNVYHMPRVPAPPGLGVFFTRYRRQLTLVLSYLDGMLDESAAQGFADDIDSTLRREE